MTDTLLIILIALAAVLLIVMVVVLVIILMNKKPDQVKLDPQVYASLAENNAKLNNLLDNMSKDIQSTVNKEMVGVLSNLNNNNELNNAKLERFQKTIQESIDAKFVVLNRQMNEQVTAMNKTMNERLEGGFKDTNETVKNVIERLAKIDEAQKNIETLSGDVLSLKSVLENNQQRGQYGEFQLKMILNNVFGDIVGSYEEQYVIKSGRDEAGTVRADAVVFLPPPYNMLCIDSKFPFQDYKEIIDCRDPEAMAEERKGFRNAVKKHITDIKNKYIIPGKTAPQAFMFIPSDGIFAYLHVEMNDLVAEAQKNNVIITSPATLQSMLSTLLMLRINYERSKNIDVITKQLKDLATDFARWASDWEKLSSHLTTVSNTQQSLDKRVNIINSRFDKINTSQIEISDAASEKND